MSTLTDWLSSSGTMAIVACLWISVWTMITIWDSGWWCNGCSTTDSWMADHRPSQPNRSSGSTRLISSGRSGSGCSLFSAGRRSKGWVRGEEDYCNNQQAMTNRAILVSDYSSTVQVKRAFAGGDLKTRMCSTPLWEPVVLAIFATLRSFVR